MLKSICNPKLTCSKCGNEVVAGGVWTGIPTYWVCDVCREKMKKIKFTVTMYEDGFQDFGGECDYCNQSPCKHLTMEKMNKVTEILWTPEVKKT